MRGSDEGTCAVGAAIARLSRANLDRRNKDHNSQFEALERGEGGGGGGEDRLGHQPRGRVIMLQLGHRPSCPTTTPPSRAERARAKRYTYPGWWQRHWLK